MQRDTCEEGRARDNQQDHGTAGRSDRPGDRTPRPTPGEPAAMVNSSPDTRKKNGRSAYFTGYGSVSGLLDVTVMGPRKLGAEERSTSRQLFKDV